MPLAVVREPVGSVAAAQTGPGLVVDDRGFLVTVVHGDSLAEFGSTDRGHFAGPASALFSVGAGAGSCLAMFDVA